MKLRLQLGVKVCAADGQKAGGMRGAADVDFVAGLQGKAKLTVNSDADSVVRVALDYHSGVGFRTGAIQKSRPAQAGF